MPSSIVAAITDTHIGGSTAIAPPKFTIHTGRNNETQTVVYNKFQEWLYSCWKDYWIYVFSLAGIRGKFRNKQLIIFHLGDVVDGLHHKSPQVMNEVKDQVEAAGTLLRPLIGFADKSYLCYGTGAHNGGAAEYEMELGNELGFRHDYEFSPIDIDGVTFDLAHHGRAGRREWTSSAAGVAAEVALGYVKNDMKPPRYVLRGHNHIIDDSGFKVKYTRAICLPSWQMPTSYGHMVAANQRWVDIGGAIFDTAEPDIVIDCKMRYLLPNIGAR